MDDKYHSRSVGCPIVGVPEVVVTLSFQVCIVLNIMQGWTGETLTMIIPDSDLERFWSGLLSPGHSCIS